jgi:hypothetical protein
MPRTKILGVLAGLSGAFIPASSSVAPTTAGRMQTFFALRGFRHETCRHVGRMEPTSEETKQWLDMMPTLPSAKDGKSSSSLWPDFWKLDALRN